jgi:hypothetical protein
MKTYFFSYFFKQKSKQKAFFKFSEDFFHYTALHENHRFSIAACFPLISQCYRMGLGAITQAQRLNLGNLGVPALGDWKEFFERRKIVLRAE